MTVIMVLSVCSPLSVCLERSSGTSDERRTALIGCRASDLADRFGLQVCKPAAIVYAHRRSHGNEQKMHRVNVSRRRCIRFDVTSLSIV